ncbi:unnamed protein product [Rotaria sp. Silwood1]|nr:unnamed protein product [Rotaria sp. Silwood1]
MPHWLPKPPGTVASYSDEGSSVAALVVERVSNMSYIDYVKQKILKPLGIDITKVGIRLSDFKNTEDLVKHYSYAFNTSYIQRWQQLLPQLNITQISDNLPTWLYISHYGFGTYPAGLLRMSASTLSIYLRMFLSNGSSILRPQSITEMRTVVGGGLIPFYSQESSSNSTVQQVLSEFGLSWYWQTMKDGRRYIGHSGAMPGMIHLMLVNEKNNLGVILLSNADDTHDAGKHAVLQAFIHAYNSHEDIILSPDDIWLLVCISFSTYVNDNSEQLRHLFVDHEGQKILTVLDFERSEPE